MVFLHWRSNRSASVLIPRRVSQASKGLIVAPGEPALQAQPVCPFLARGNHAAGGVAVPAEILRRRMDHHVDPERRRVARNRRREGVVDRDHSACLMRNLRQRRQVGDAHQRIGNRFTEKQFRLEPLHRRAHGVEVLHIDQLGANAHVREHVGDDGKGRAVDIAGGDDGVACLDIDRQRSVDRGHAGRVHAGVIRAFEFGNRLFERARRWIAISAVDVPFSLLPEDRVEIGGRVIGKGGRGVDRGRCRDEIGMGWALTGVDGPACEAAWALT